MSTIKKSATILDGKKLAEKHLRDLAKRVHALKRRPGLAAILVGEDAASHLYVKNKKKACQKVGIDFHEYLCGDACYPNIEQKELSEMVDWLNKDDAIDGIIIQLPLPKDYDTDALINQLDVNKDVDVFHPDNHGKFLTDKTKPIPPLIAAIALALKESKQELSGKSAVIIAKNEIFSRSLDKALEQKGIVATTIKPDDKKLFEEIKKADILITVVGKKHYITDDMVKPDAIVIDIGTTLGDDEKLYGDVDPKVAKVASFLTPVPGGVGALTVAMLLENVYMLAAKKE